MLLAIEVSSPSLSSFILLKIATELQHKLEKVAIAKRCNLKAARFYVAPVVLSFNYEADNAPPTN